MNAGNYVALVCSAVAIGIVLLAAWRDWRDRRRQRDRELLGIGGRGLKR